MDGFYSIATNIIQLFCYILGKMADRKEYWRKWKKIARNHAAALKEVADDVHHKYDSDDTSSDGDMLCEAIPQMSSHTNYAACSNSSSVLLRTSDADSSDNDMQSGESTANVQTQNLNLYDIIDNHVTLDSEVESDDEHLDALKANLVSWSNDHGIKHRAVNDLLKMLKAGVPALSSLPLCARTLLKTPRNIVIQQISGMDYYYFGLEYQLRLILASYPQTMVEALNTLELILNIDGLPLFRSSSTNVWPVLCMVRNLCPKKVFPIVLTSGKHKPTNLDFLNETVCELSHLSLNGIDCGQLGNVHVILKCVVCDAPARAMVKNTKLCSGYFGCDKCTQKGEWVGCVTYPNVNFESRTDESFRNFDQMEHHKGGSPFVNLHDVDMITTFSIDYMHQVCLGVMKRLILLWVRGPRAFRLSALQITQINDRLRAFVRYIPEEFARKPRGFDEIEYWKATEYRQFLLYTGQFVLKGLLSDVIYSHFMDFSVALCILVSPRLARMHAEFAHNLLRWFVDQSRTIYGQEFMVYNVHSLLHLRDEVSTHGCLDSCAAWYFESYLHQVKKLVRSGKNPTAQIVKRLKEHQDGVNSSTSASVQEISTQSPNNAFMMENGDCCEVVGIQRQGGCAKSDILCRIYRHRRKKQLFTTPCDSIIIGFVKVHQSQSSMQIVQQSSLAGKCIAFDCGEWRIFLNLLHHI